jgi:4-hydroxybenzoyl-CoA thioesterase
MTVSEMHPFRAQLIVRFGDIDEAGFVYYPRLVHYFHVAMEEFFAGVLEVDYSHFLFDHRRGLPTAHLEVDFHRPLHYGDRLEVEVMIETARLVTVNMDMDTYTKCELPDWLRKKLEAYRKRN